MAISKITANSVNLTSLGRDDDANTSIDFDGSDVITINTGGSEAMRVDSSQRVLMGHTSSLGNNRQFQVINGANNAVASLITAVDGNGGGQLEFMKGRGGVAQNNATIVQEDDSVGFIRFFGADGTDLKSEAVRFSAEIDGTPGSDDMPGRLVFSTTSDGSNSPTERMRIDSSGNLLVGQSSSTHPANDNTVGMAIRGDGLLSITRNQDPAAHFNRKGNEGQIVVFRQDDTVIGAIGSDNRLWIADGTAGGVRFAHLGGGAMALQPVNNSGGGTDNTHDLGLSNNRWNDAYITNGVTTGSDERDKQDIDVLSESEQRVAVACKGLLRKWRWKNAVAEKGDDARIHFGIIAQDLQAAFEAEGLDAGRYGMFMYNEWWEAEETYTDDEGVEQTRINTYDTAEEAPEGATERTRLGVRYSELLAFIIAAI